MSNLLLDILGTAGTVLDTPRSMAWALASGRDPLEAMLHPDKRLTGWDLMKGLGIQNKPGFDSTDVLAVGSEMVLDPLNLLFGAGLLKGGGKAAKAAKASNALRAKRLATGGMPEEVAKLTKATTEAGTPKRLYHGTSHAYTGKPDFGKLYEDDWVKGHFTTENPKVASGYAENTSGLGAPRASVSADELERVRQSTMTKLRDSGTLQRWEKAAEKAEPYDVMIQPTSMVDYAFDEAKQTGRLRGVVDELADIEKHEGLDFSTELDALTKPYNPNVRMQYLDVRKPFDLDATYDARDLPKWVSGKADLLKDAGLGEGRMPVMGGQEIIDAIGFNPGVSAGYSGPQAVTEGLQRLGYDALTHRGGLGGRTSHQVHVAFGPEQIYSPWIAPALRPVPKASKAMLAALLSPSLGARMHGLGPDVSLPSYP